MNIIAEIMLKQMTGRVFLYDIFEGMHTGKCTIENIKYDDLIHRFIFCLRDTASKNTFTIDRCHAYLKEVEI